MSRHSPRSRHARTSDTDALTERPLRFHVARDEYLIAYAPDEKPLWIVAVFHGRRNPRLVAAILRERHRSRDERFGPKVSTSTTPDRNALYTGSLDIHRRIVALYPKVAEKHAWFRDMHPVSPRIPRLLLADLAAAIQIASSVR